MEAYGRFRIKGLKRENSGMAKSWYGRDVESVRQFLKTWGQGGCEQKQVAALVLAVHTDDGKLSGHTGKCFGGSRVGL